MSPSPSVEPSRERLRELLGRSIHDLRNPLSVVRASLEWLEIELAGREDVLDAVRDASTATSRILLILEDLATLSRLESGDPLAHGAVDIGATIERVAVAANARLQVRGLSVVALPATAPLHAPGEGRLVERAIEALVDVCARGAPAGGCVEVGARVVDTDGDAPFVELSIGLRGALIEPGQVGSIEALASGGVGVYLALRVVEVHGGSLVVHMTTTVPTTILRLPLA
jgi:signal transduction histidine kinase